ncbi:hypothetical protein F4677DRAFT_422525 [Hypoxylon crocopeplum]|nr:hypothetical protein F4677DRAFT_422525 [Hypoxylon crocopeplum]
MIRLNLGQILDYVILLFLDSFLLPLDRSHYVPHTYLCRYIPMLPTLYITFKVKVLFSCTIIYWHLWRSR